MSDERASRAGGYAVAAVVLIAATLAIVQSWGRWLDPFVDAGRDLYIPEQLRHGAKLYADILYFYPPLTPLLLAVVTATVGASLTSYVAIGFAIAALTALALWSTTRALAGPLAGAGVLLCFVSLNVAGMSGWGNNYLFPYAHAATLAMLFFLGGAALLLARQPAFAIVLLALAAVTKIEFAAFALGLVALSVLTARLRPLWGIAWGLLVTVAAVAMASAYGIDALRANAFPSSLLGGESARRFYALVNGSADWQRNLMLSLRGAVLLAAIALMLRAWDSRPRLRLALVAGIAIAGWLLADGTFFRAWSVLQLALVPFALRRPKEPLAFVLALSLCGSSRIFLNIVPTWYGFVFILPVYILIAFVLLEWLPQREVYSRRAARAWFGVFVLIAGSGLVAAREAYRGGARVETGRGVYLDRTVSRAASVATLLAHLERVHASELVVMPEGLAINYLARVRTPLRFQTFTPVEIVGAEDAAVRDLARRRPERVLLAPRDTREFGYRGFGIDYGRGIVAFLRENYTLEGRFGELILLEIRKPPGTRLPDSPSARTPAPTRR